MGNEPKDVGLSQLFANGEWLRRIASQMTDRDDVVQETWIAALRRPPATDRPIRPWLSRVLRNAGITARRRERRRASYEEAAGAAQVSEQIDTPSPEALAERLEALRRLAGAVLELEQAERQVILLHYGEGLTSNEIASQLGVPASTVRWRLRGALGDLRRKLGIEEPERRRAWIVLGKGVMAMKTTKVAIAVVIMLCALIVGRSLGHRHESDDASAQRAAAKNTHGKLAPIRIAEPSGGTPWIADDGGARGVPAWFVQAGARPRHVAGRVVHDGKPVAGARVRLLSILTDLGIAPMVERQTGADGRFDLGLQPAGTYHAVAWLPGLREADEAVDLRGPGRADRLELILGDCNDVVSGLVTDVEGRPLAGAHVADADAGEGAAVLTDDDGLYQLCVARGQNTLRATATGYGTMITSDVVKRTAKIDFALPAETIITGEVVRADDGSPVAGAYVWTEQFLIGSGHSQAMPYPIKRNAITDASGKFWIAGVPAGSISIEARTDGLRSSEATEAVAQAGAVTDVKVLVEGRAHVSGVMRDRATGAPIGGAHVRVSEQRVWSGDGLTQEDGTFDVAGVMFGDQQVMSPENEITPDVKLHVTGDVRGVVLDVQPLARISGVVSQRGNPMAGVFVFAAGSTAQSPTTYTRADGTFELVGLPPGNYRLTAEDNDPHVQIRVQENVEVTLAAGERRTDVVIPLELPAAIAGVVLDEHGAPVAGAFVGTVLHGIVAGKVTDAQGAFALEDLEVGEHQLQVRAAKDGPPYALISGPTTITLGDGVLEERDVRLTVRREDLAIAGVVVDENGAPRAGVIVDARSGVQVLGAAVTDERGVFRVTGLTSGTAAYVVEVRGLVGSAQADDVAPGAEEVRLVLRSSARLIGTVSGFRAVPEVRVQELAAPYELRRAPVAGDRFELAGLTPGEYVVTAQVPGESSLARVALAAGADGSVALASAGSVTLSGTVVDLANGAAVPGVECSTSPRSGDVQVVGAGGMGAQASTDDRGVFTMTDAPAGDVDVVCSGGTGYSSGRTHVGAPGAATTTIRVPLVKKPTAHAGGGFTIDPDAISARIGAVTDPALVGPLQAGDVILAVNGVSTAQLSRDAVELLIFGHVAGTMVEVTVERGAVAIRLF